jgi:U3 small nucleolar RNA-associated protein 13
LESLAATVKGVALLRFVCAIKAWNSNARFCDPAQRCLAALLRHRSLRELSGVKGVKDHVASLKAYTTRHFARAGRLVRGTYLLDVALAGMGVLLDDEEKSAPAPSAPPRRLLAEMARNWDSGRDDSVPMVGALGAPAKQAAALPALRTRGGDDEDDFDLGHFSEDDDDDGGGGGGGAVPDRFAAGGGDGDDDDDDDDDLSAEEDGDGDVESDSDDAPDEVATVKRGKGGAKEKPPPAKSADAAAALGLSAISPRKTRGQRRAESESDSEAAAAPEAAPAKPKKRAATKRKAALAPVEEEPATQPKRATRARSKK